MTDSKVVYIGKKPVMSYVLAALTSLQQKGSSEVILKARGRAISIAVDTAEVTRNRFLSELSSEVSIGTEELPREGGGTRNVSTMEIVLKKSAKAEEPSEVDNVPQVNEDTSIKPEEAVQEKNTDEE
jgi:DNA-binding protein